MNDDVVPYVSGRVGVSECELFFFDHAIPPQCGASNVVKYINLFCFSPHSPDSQDKVNKMEGVPMFPQVKAFKLWL